MRIKALLALLGLGLALFFVAGCDDDNDEVSLGTVTGTITNASTGLGQGNASVSLLNSGVVIQTTQTSNDPATLGLYTFTNVPVGSGYTILVTSNDVPPAFSDTTSTTFTVVEGTTTTNLTVGTGIIGTTVSGIIGTIETTDTFAVTIKQGTTTVASTTTGPADEPAFTLTNVPPASGYTIQVVNNTTGITTVFGPLTVPESGVTGVTVFTRSEAQLEADGVPGTANLVAYIAGGGTITANGVTSTSGNPTWLTNVTAGDTLVTINPPSGNLVQLTVPVSATNVTVIRLNETN